MVTFDRGMVYHHTMEQFCEVNKDTRAGGRTGKKINCPHCGATYMVFHFSWTALECMTCEAEVNKNDWLIKIGESLWKR